MLFCARPTLEARVFYSPRSAQFCPRKTAFFDKKNHVHTKENLGRNDLFFRTLK